MSNGNKDTLKYGAFAFGILIAIFLLEKFVIKDYLINFIIDYAVIYCAVLWCLFNMVSGTIQARNNFYRQSSSVNDEYNEHGALAIEAAFVFIPLMIIMNSWVNDLLVLGLRIFLHDGIFYYKTNKLNGAYPKGFWDQSTTSTSWMDRKHLTGPILRTTLFIICLTGLIIYNYATY